MSWQWLITLTLSWGWVLYLYSKVLDVHPHSFGVHNIPPWHQHKLPPILLSDCKWIPLVEICLDCGALNYVNVWKVLVCWNVLMQFFFGTRCLFIVWRVLIFFGLYALLLYLKNLFAQYEKPQTDMTQLLGCSSNQLLESNICIPIWEIYWMETFELWCLVGEEPPCLLVSIVAMEYVVCPC